MFSDGLTQKAKGVLAACQEKNFRLAVAESCTGGLVSALFTNIPGSSAVFERGFVTYSDTAKNELLGVSSRQIKKHGAVSKEVARAMVLGALEYSDADIAAAITGIAGPGGGSPEKPVGLVYIAVAMDDDMTIEEHFFEGDRQAVRTSAVMRAVEMLSLLLDS